MSFIVRQQQWTEAPNLNFLLRLTSGNKLELEIIYTNKVTVSVSVCPAETIFVWIWVVLKFKYFTQISDSEYTSTNKSCPQGLEFQER